MSVRRALATSFSVAAGAYPLLVYGICRSPLILDGPWALPVLLVAVALPAVFASLWAARVAARRNGAVRWTVFAVLLALCAIALWNYAPRLQPFYPWFFLLQDSAFFALLAYCFGMSLLPGRDPLCAFFARLVHPRMSDALLQYTRFITKVWTLFFLVVGASSALLFLLAPRAVWALFVNLVVPVLIVALFLIENACRGFVLPPEDLVGLRGTWRAIRAGSARGTLRSFLPRSESAAEVRSGPA